ncbi:ROK family protein [Micromonospora sp. NPDC048999]|uniref:ROK family protein n=1 Tax=Micromonospora sp. NPDC048999 TaxID=3155391 RepID=UPI0033D2844A
MTDGRVLAIDFGGTKVAMATATATSLGRLGTVLRLQTQPSAGADQVVRRSLEAARTLIAAPASVGVSTFGVVRGGRVQLAPNVPGWDGMELPRLLREEFGTIPVAIDNDVKAAARAELRWGALRGVDVGVYLNLGTGLATALVVGGTVVRGAHGAAGEIAYLISSAGESGFADGRAPCEELVSGAALAARGSAALGRPVTAHDLFTMHDDPTVRPLLDDATATLAMVVANVCITLNPERVVVGGGMMRAAHHILPRIRAEVGRTVPFPPTITTARFIDDAPLLGALALALDSIDPSENPSC